MIKYKPTETKFEVENYAWGTGLFDTYGEEAFVGDQAVDQYGKEFTVTYGPCQATPHAFSNFIPCVHASYLKNGDKYQMPDRFTLNNKLFGGVFENTKSEKTS